MLLPQARRRFIHSSVPSSVSKPIEVKKNDYIGGVTGAIEITCTYPTEYTKTIMQLNPEFNK